MCWKNKTVGKINLQIRKKKPKQKREIEIMRREKGSVKNCVIYHTISGISTYIFLHLASFESFFPFTLRSTPRIHSQITFKIVVQSLFLSIVYVTYLYVSSPVKIYIAQSVPCADSLSYDVWCNLRVANAFSLFYTISPLSYSSSSYPFSAKIKKESQHLI